MHTLVANAARRLFDLTALSPNFYLTVRTGEPALCVTALVSGNPRVGAGFTICGKLPSYGAQFGSGLSGGA